MKVHVFNEQTDLEIAPVSVSSVVKAVLELEGRSTDEVTIYFVSTEEISLLHKEFFDDPSTTDCISFPMDQKEKINYHVLGEIFVCPKTAIDFLLKTSEEIEEDCYRETTLYLVHGLLHLLGYDDIEKRDEEKMRAAENRVMEHLIKSQILLFP